MNSVTTAAKAIHDHLPAITAAMQFLTTIGVGLIPAYVYIYTKRKDKLEFFYNNWNKQQDVNLECLGNDELLRAFEELVNGPDHVFDLRIARSFTLAFLHLNKIQNNFQAMTQGVLSKREYLEMSIPSLRLFARDKELITYLVSQRGYGEDFRDSILGCLKDLAPYELPGFIPSDTTNSSVLDMVEARLKIPHQGQESLGPHLSSAQLPTRLMIRLSKHLHRFLHGKFFYALSFSFVLNPLLLGAQLIKAAGSGDFSGLSPIMFGGFAMLNIVTCLAGIKLRNATMFISFLISFVISAAIVLMICVSDIVIGVH